MKIHTTNYNILQKVLLIYEKVCHSNDLSILRCYTWLQNALTLLFSHTPILSNLAGVGH